MSPGIAESHVEEAALAWLDELGYKVASGLEIGPDGGAPERVSYGDVVLATHRYPGFAAVRSEERLMRRASDIGCVLHPIGCGVDKRHRVRGDRDDCERLAIGREAETMDEYLSLVERRQVHGLRIAKSDDTEIRIGRRVDDRDGVRKLLGSIDAVLAA